MLIGIVAKILMNVVKNSKNPKPRMSKIIPSTSEIISGTVEKAIIPSIEYLNSFQNDHFVSPAAR